MGETYNLKKECEVCHTPIPDSFGNLLCPEHYKESEKVEESTEDQVPEEKVKLRKERQEKGQEKEQEQGLKDMDPDIKLASQKPDPTIKQEGYMENPEQPDKDQVMTNLKMFVKGDILLWHHQRDMYTAIKNRMIEKTQQHAQFSKHIWKPRVVDVGCGSGVGSNILSWEADFVWGIDKNKPSISFAKQAFTREKNGIYYSSQVDFDEIDILKEEREVMTFDYVVAIEIIEHINDWKRFVEQIIRLFTNREKSGAPRRDFYATEFYISTPNRNHKRISDKSPKNPFHVREWTSQEFVEAMGQYFEEVKLLTTDGSTVPLDTDDSPVMAKCRFPK